MTTTVLRRLSGADLGALDAVLAVALAALCAYAASEEPLAGGVHEPAWLSVLAGVIVGGPVAVRRRWPLPVLGAVFAAAATVLLSGVVPDYAAAAPVTAVACALYTVGVLTPRRRSVWALAGSLAGTSAVVLPAAVAAAGADLAVVAFVAPLLSAAWLLGRYVRQRRAYAARAAAQATQRAVTDERLRIARELHDVVAHSMSLIAVKAAVGNHVAQARPQEAREALRVIEATSRGALLEMRRALGVLRAEDAAYAPAPGLGDLERLAEQAAGGGLDVDLTVDGDGPVPEGVGLSVYRIVQEALTNAVTHAAPARCRAVVTVDRQEVRIEVTDDGRRATAPVTGGHGLVGIGERVGMYGGEYTAGPRPEGGFRVTARLPYGAQP